MAILAKMAEMGTITYCEQSSKWDDKGSLLKVVILTKMAEMANNRRIATKYKGPI